MQPNNSTEESREKESTKKPGSGSGKKWHECSKEEKKASLLKHWKHYQESGAMRPRSEDPDDGG
jgi:hypothetical protein